MSILLLTITSVLLLIHFYTDIKSVEIRNRYLKPTRELPAQESRQFHRMQWIQRLIPLGLGIIVLIAALPS